MTSSEIRGKFLEFFKKNGHAVVPSSSLIPDDPSVLLTTAGMQQFKPYYTNDSDPMKDFNSKNTASVQKCFRTSDIDEVGDESHLTFFEMLGNFSFGGYFKKEAIRFGYDFIVKEMGLEIEYVTVFDPAKVPEDDWRKNGVPFDKESYAIWKDIGMPEKKIIREGVDVFWGPTGNEGPCGPTTEIYVKNATGKAVEVWNIVFNQFYAKNQKLAPLETPGVDTGMGLERLTMVSQKKATIFETDLFAPIIALLPEEMEVRTRRILSDHIRGIAFLISDGVKPSNKEAGYVLRRLMRRVMVHLHLSKNEELAEHLFGEVFENYEGFYPELNRELVLDEFNKEKEAFSEALKKGAREFEKAELTGEIVFDLYQTHGLPIEMIEELAKEKGISIDKVDFERRKSAHQELSRTSSAGQFKGGLADHSEKTVRLHTAHHLLLKALQMVLGPEVKQRGSNITSERLRMDFIHNAKMTDEQKKEAERIVNEKIAEDLPVVHSEIAREEAENLGAEHEFGQKYPDTVSIYSVGPKGATAESPQFEKSFSIEFCGGPHVAHTGEVGRFKIIKEEAVAAGIRRIRATVE
ncbi:MAG: alanine--tRNA ligase [Patescibacteria group bacterium]